MNGVLNATASRATRILRSNREAPNAQASELRKFCRAASSISHANRSWPDTRRLTDRGSRSADHFESAAPWRSVSMRVDFEDMADLNRQERVLPDLPL